MKLITETLALIDAPTRDGKPGFCCGIVLWDDCVVEAALKVRRLKGKSRADVRAYCLERGFTVAVVSRTERTMP